MRQLHSRVFSGFYYEDDSFHRRSLSFFRLAYLTKSPVPFDPILFLCHAAPSIPWDSKQTKKICNHGRLLVLRDGCCGEY